MGEFLLGTGLVVAIIYMVVNGFHDAANANALPVRFNALTPRVAAGMGALFNLAGALTVGLVLTRVMPFDAPIPLDPVGAVILVMALLSATGWNILTWWWAMPSSSTAAVSGGIAGALGGAYAVGLVAGLPIEYATVWQAVMPAVVVPFVAFVLAQALVIGCVYLARHESPGVVKSRSEVVQATGAAAIHFGHGVQHARRGMWIVAALLICGGVPISLSEVPWWIPTLVGLSLGAGTLLGGWRIAYTLSSRVVTLDPLRGAVAQTVSGALLLTCGFLAPFPVSTSQTSIAAILGVGSLQRFRTVYHRTLVRIVATWLVTFPACAVIAGTLFLAFSPLLTRG